MAKINDKVKDIFQYLTDDHRKISAVLEGLVDIAHDSEEAREQMFDELDSILSLHAELEEATLYPALEEKPDMEDMISRFKGEHEEVKSLLEELRITDKDSGEWLLKLIELRESVGHYVEEEEEIEGLFEQAQEVLSIGEEEEIRKNMEEFLSGE